MSKTPCGFCESVTEQITNEHIFGKWIGALFGAGQSERVVRHTLKRDDSRIPSRLSASLDHRVRMACQLCNNGWMSALEDTVNPIIAPLIQRSANKLLSPSDQSAIARWAVKTVMVMEYMARPEQRYFTQRERSSVRDNSVLSRYIGAHVWLGRYDGTNDGVMSVATSLTQEDRIPRAHLSTFAIGRLLVQALVERNSVGRVIVAARPGPWDRLLIRLWPLPLLQRSRLFWPPPIFITARGFDAVFNRFFDPDVQRGPYRAAHGVPEDLVIPE